MIVSVLIPTFRRPDSFLRAARSVFAQSDLRGVELIAIDNSPEGSAMPAFRALAEEAPIPFRWSHEPQPGVARARNAALALAHGDLVAWLDDDEEASPTWLAALVATRHDTGAQSVFGPVKARAPEGVRRRAFYERLYSRTGPRQSGEIVRAYGIGNSLQPRLMFEDFAFDIRTDETGGEDDALFSSWRAAGAIFAWAADAQVTEHVGAERARLRYGFKRAFAYGQGPCETAWAEHHDAALLRHMSVGAAQMLVFGLSGSVAYSFRIPGALLLLDRAARGAGKVFWFWPQRFYGDALARTRAAPPWTERAAPRKKAA